MLTESQLNDFRQRIEEAVSENGSYTSLDESGTLILDGNFSTTELRNLARVMDIVDMINDPD